MAVRKRTRSRWTTAKLCDVYAEGYDGDYLHPTRVDAHNIWNYSPYGLVERITDEDRKANFRYGLTTTSRDRGGPMTLQRVHHRNYPGSFPGGITHRWGPPPGFWRATSAVSGGVITGDWGLVTGNTSKPGPAGWDSTSGLPSLSLLDAKSKGPTGFRRFSPVKPQAGMGQFIGELRQMPTIPLLLLKRLYNLKAVGHEYLNIEFGWRPFLKDLQDMIKVSLTLEQRLRALQRNNGQPVRRRGKIDSDLVSSVSKSTGHYSLPVMSGTYYWNAQGTETKTTSIVTSTKYDFSASFVYYFPDFQDLSKHRARLLRILYGVELNPRIVWELMPWSWLIDWFTNTGDIISNIVDSAEDGLVANYAYCTGRYVKETRTVVTGTAIYKENVSGPPRYIPYSCSYHRTDEVIDRAKASPYDFSLTIPELSARRIAILVALGLTRSKFLGKQSLPSLSR